MAEHRVGIMNRTGRIVAATLGLWFVVALAVGASGLYYGTRTPVIGATNALLVSLTLLAVFFVRPLRNWVSEIPLRWLVLFHAVRFVGIAFLVPYARGAIPGEFAVMAGWGDIAVAVTAIIVAVRPCRSRPGPAGGSCCYGMHSGCSISSLYSGPGLAWALRIRHK